MLSSRLYDYYTTGPSQTTHTFFDRAEWPGMLFLDQYKYQKTLTIGRHAALLAIGAWTPYPDEILPLSTPPESPFPVFYTVSIFRWDGREDKDGYPLPGSLRDIANDPVVCLPDAESCSYIFDEIAQSAIALQSKIVASRFN